MSAIMPANANLPPNQVSPRFSQHALQLHALLIQALWQPSQLEPAACVPGTPNSLLTLAIGTD